MLDFREMNRTEVIGAGRIEIVTPGRTISGSPKSLSFESIFQCLRDFFKILQRRNTLAARLKREYRALDEVISPSIIIV